MSKDIKLGIVGLGLGQWQVNTVKEIDGARVAAVAEMDPGRLNLDPDDYSRKHGLVFYKDALEMMDSEDLDAVSLAVSPRYRPDLIRAAGERGLPMRNRQQG